MSRPSRRRLISGVTLSVAVILVAIGASTATAQPSRASNRWNHVPNSPTSRSVTPAAVTAEPAMQGAVWKKFHFFEQFGRKFKFVDVAPKGDSPGDYGVFKDPVKTRDGFKVGTIDAQCISAYSDQCWGSISLAGHGQITFAGITPIGVDPDRYAITGGTGEYAGVGGVLLIEFPFVDAAKLTITLTR